MTFFEPNTDYIANNAFRAPELNPQFRCEAVAIHPRNGTLRAFGFYRSGTGQKWVSVALQERHWESGLEDGLAEAGWVAA